MIHQKEIVVGSRDTLAVRFAFLPNPDAGSAETVEHSLSWGCFEIWVHGRNLCQHLEDGQPMPAVHWYLLPLLEWFVSNWDFLFHEERLPAQNAAPDAQTSLYRTTEPPPGLTEMVAEKWEIDWQQWWSRHCLLACREGGLFPNVVIRRWRDRIEFSWGNVSLAGAPEHYRFDLFPGYARLEPSVAAETFFEALKDAAEYLLSQEPNSPRLQQLREDVHRLAKYQRQEKQLGLLAGLNTESDNPESQWHKVQSYFPADLSPAIRQELFEVQMDNHLVIPGTCQAALMFGSVSPLISEKDARTLAGKLVNFYSPEGEKARLKELRREEPLENSEERAWKQGYDLAEDFLEALGQPFANQEWIDIEEIYKELGIPTDNISLDDKSIRAVAIAGPFHQPTVLVNSHQDFTDPERRRFTLAHELCHLLHDRSFGARLALASGPWAPLDVERRANAFAAMLLMPRFLVAAAVGSLHQPLDQVQSVEEVARRLRTSFTATLEHLCNLGFLDETTRDAIRAAVDTRAVRN